MNYEVKMPQLGMNQDTAVVVAWFKKEGDKIEKGTLYLRWKPIKLPWR